MVPIKKGPKNCESEPLFVPASHLGESPSIIKDQAPIPDSQHYHYHHQHHHQHHHYHHHHDFGVPTFITFFIKKMPNSVSGLVVR